MRRRVRPGRPAKAAGAGGGEVVDVLVGRVAALREVRKEDLSVIHALIWTDPALHATVQLVPWMPLTVQTLQDRFFRDEDKQPALDAAVQFTVRSATDNAGRCQGWATLWGIDLHQRTAHFGLGLLPASRGKGMGVDVLRLLCRYAFEVRDLQRVALETLATNEPMRRAALAAGFTQEGVLRENAYVMGERVDDIVFGLLRHEWKALQATATG